MAGPRQPPSIDAYGGGGFRVSGVWRPGSLLIVDDVAADWPATRLETLTPDDFRPVFDAKPGVVEFVLLGTGAQQALPPKAVRDAIRVRGLGLEFMASEAAARMYNVLAAEGRRMAAAIIAI